MDKALAVTGLISSLAGVIILFHFGMPYRTRTGGASLLSVGIQDINEPKREARYNTLGNCGLILIIFGTALQVFLAFKADTPQDANRIISIERRLQLQSDILASQERTNTSLSNMIVSLKNKEQIGHEASREGYEQNRARIEALGRVDKRLQP